MQAVNQLLGAPLGTSVVLECYVEAYPNPVNYWIKNPDVMLLEGYVEIRYSTYLKLIRRSAGPGL